MDLKNLEAMLPAIMMAIRPVLKELAVANGGTFTVENLPDALERDNHPELRSLFLKENKEFNRELNIEKLVVVLNNLIGE